MSFSRAALLWFAQFATVRAAIKGVLDSEGKAHLRDLAQFEEVSKVISSLQLPQRSSVVSQNLIMGSDPTGAKIKDPFQSLLDILDATWAAPFSALDLHENFLQLCNLITGCLTVFVLSSFTSRSWVE